MTFSGSYDGISALLIVLLVFALLLTLLFIVISPLFIFIAILKRKAERYKQLRSNTIIAQYDPPMNLAPAEIGYLYDMKCDAKELWATLIDLKIRRIVSFSSPKDVKIIDTSLYGSLREFEKFAVYLVSDDAPKPQLVTKNFTIIDENGVPHTQAITLPARRSLSTFTSKVRASLHSRQIKTRSYVYSVIGYGFLVGACISIVPGLFVIGINGDYNGVAYEAWSAAAIESGLFISFFISFFVWPLYLGFGCVAVILWGKLAGRYWLNTSSVRKLWPELEGYRLFLKKVEEDNLQFAVQQGDAKAVFVTILPYIIVLNLDIHWRSAVTIKTQR